MAFGRNRAAGNRAVILFHEEFAHGPVLSKAALELSLVLDGHRNAIVPSRSVLDELVHLQFPPARHRSLED